MKYERDFYEVHFTTDGIDWQLCRGPKEKNYGRCNTVQEAKDFTVWYDQEEKRMDRLWKGFVDMGPSCKKQYRVVKVHKEEVC